tara:strand:+ start:69 stop:827 length:759 start_codon:yes stop_codon:yes gene_type:complete
MASKLTNWINSKLKAKGMSSKEAQKSAGKYSSIAAAKRAGSLYYTDKKGRVMIAAYAEDLKAPIKPVKRPEVKVKKTETVSNKEVEKAIAKAKSKIKIAESEASVRAAEKAFAEADRKLDIFNKTNVLNETARKFKEEKVKLKNEIKEKLKGPKVSVTIIKASPGPLKRKPTAKELNSESDQDSLDKALRMNNKTEEERDARRSGNKKDIRNSIEREADLLEQERKKNYKRGKATKRAKGGLIDMRKTGLFR